MKIVGVFLGAAFVSRGLAVMTGAAQADKYGCYDGSGKPMRVTAKACVGGVLQERLQNTYGKSFSWHIPEGKPEKCCDSQAK